jgi:hypothetical protein
MKKKGETDPTPSPRQYPRLFEISSIPNILVDHAYTSEGWHQSFRRSSGDPELALWRDIENLISQIVLSASQDSLNLQIVVGFIFIWKITSKEITRISLNSSGRPSSPLYFIKIKILTWRSVRGRLATGDQPLKHHNP